jgi:hypothetical protein
MLIVPSKSHLKVKEFVEDEVTSTVFGPLQFMSPQDAWDAVVSAGLIKKDNNLSVAPVRDHAISFWQFYKNPDPNKGDWQRKEPDAVFRLDFGDSGKLWLVLEVKWTAKQSSHDRNGNGAQLAHQWMATKKAAKDEGAHVRQAYLTLHQSEAISGISEDKQPVVSGFEFDQWRKEAKPVPITWLDVRKNLSAIEQKQTPIGRWAKEVCNFLGIRGVRSFHGFADVDLDCNFCDVAFRFQQPFRWPTASSEGLTPFRFSKSEGDHR